MSISFSLAKKIIDSPVYNFGLALPFVAAFYLLNDTAPIVVPLFHTVLGEQMTMLLKIFGVAFYYVVYLLFCVFSGGLSRLTTDSKHYLAYPIITSLLALYSFLNPDDAPKFSLLFGALSLLYLALIKFEDGYLSLLLVGSACTALALLSLVTGILWFDNHYIFMPAISSLFGFASLTHESLQIGSMMFITVGYVFFYTVFQTSELWNK